MRWPRCPLKHRLWTISFRTPDQRRIAMRLGAVLILLGYLLGVLFYGLAGLIMALMHIGMMVASLCASGRRNRDAER
jgi:hypothetical protein